MENENFKIYFRLHAMEMLKCKRAYKQCLALPFMVYIDAKGNVWPCIVFMGKKELSYGNLNEETFVQIWRLDEMNKYLDVLKHPGEHVNFI